MKTYETIIAVVVTGLACTAATSRADFVVNGSFESVTPVNQISGPNTSGAGWGTYSSIPGWAPASGTPGLEIGLGSIYGVTGYVGDNVMELDSTDNVMADQLVPTSPAGSYTLSFLYAARAGVLTTTTTFNVYWNGSLVSSFTPTLTSMTLYMTTVTGLDDSTHNLLEFVGTGDSDSYGALIDDVEVNGNGIGTHGAVPETSTIMAGALMLLPLGIGAIRSVRKDRNA